MRTTLLAVALLGAACAPTTPSMQKDDMSRIDQDHHECVVEAEKLIHFGSPSRWHFYTVCMRARGYRD